MQVEKNGKEPPKPNNTLYFKNLNEKIPLKERRTDLVQALRTVCSEYGKVLDVMAKKNIKMRGQAFVVFETTQGATAALNKLQKLKLYEKELKQVIAYAKCKSDLISKADGTFVPRKSRLEIPKTLAMKAPEIGGSQRQKGKASLIIKTDRRPDVTFV